MRLPFDRTVGGLLARKLWRGAGRAADLRVAGIPCQPARGFFRPRLSARPRGAAHFGRRVARSPAERDRVANPARRTGGDGPGNPAALDQGACSSRDARTSTSPGCTRPSCASSAARAAAIATNSRLVAGRGNRREMDGAARGRLNRQGSDPGRCRGRLGRQRRASVRSSSESGSSPSGGRWSSFESGRSGLKDLPLVDDSDGRFYFKGEGDRTIWLSPHDEIATDPCDAAPEEIDIATAIDRFEGVVDWPVEAVERSWAGLRSFAPGPAAGLRIRLARAGILLVRRAGRVRDPDRAGGGKAGGGRAAGRGSRMRWSRISTRRFSRLDARSRAVERTSNGCRAGFQQRGGGCAGCRLRRRRARRRGRFRDGRCGP